jgi:hypothetical protein
MYLCVVDICECPANSASKRTPTPLLNWSMESSSKHVTDEDLSNLLAEIEEGYEEEGEDYLDDEGWELEDNYFVLEGGLLIEEA